MNFNTIKEIVKKAKAKTLIALPDHPQKIEDQIKNSLPFTLLLQTLFEKAEINTDTPIQKNELTQLTTNIQGLELEEESTNEY
ncbi:5881_t:CDS:2 [Gigaspora rosea]|nr:5881_t:CDS:2 [Gigaspora rosea]